MKSLRQQVPSFIRCICTDRSDPGQSGDQIIMNLLAWLRQKVYETTKNTGWI